MSEGKKNLVKKLVRVMKAVGAVEKNGRNDFHKYNYVKESDVMEAIRPHLIENGLFITSSVEGSQKDGDFVSVMMLHTIIDEDTGESLQVKSLGLGQDKGDKASAKAVTAATKYFLLKNFLLSTDKDDPEATDEKGKSTSSLKATDSVASVSEAKPLKRSFANNKPKTPVVENSNEF